MSGIPGCWARWGLSICEAVRWGVPIDELHAARRGHYLVARFLDAQESLSGQAGYYDEWGTLRYLDVLSDAERELER